MAPRKPPTTDEAPPPNDELPIPAWINPWTGEPNTIHVLLGKVLDELPAIGKDQVNTQQNFKFRGIDQVLDALNPMLGKYGVFYVPAVIERIEAERSTKSGGMLYVVNLHVRYTFYGPRGDSVEASAWGEGTDAGDKATPKAMTGAMKNVLFQVFAISVKEVSDNESDRLTPPATISAQMKKLMDRWKALPGDVGERVANKILTDAFNDPSLGTLLDFDGDDKWMPLFDQLLTIAENKVAEQSATEPVTQQEQPPVSEPDRTPPATPVSTPAADPPETGPVTEPDDEPSGEDDSVEWDAVTQWGVRKVKTELAKLSNPPMLSGKESVEELREAYWLAIGGTFEEDDEAKPEFPCPTEGCDTFPFTSQADLDEHMDTVHGFQAPDDESAPEPAPATNGTTPEPATEDQLAILQPMLAELKGDSARAYATYRRTNGLPGKPEDLTSDQVIELVDYLESLNA